MSKIYLRPHHGLCIQYYTGRGYNEEFTTNMDYITDVLKGNPAQEIVLRTGADVLCECCPHYQEGACRTEEKAAGYDSKCLSLSGFHDGQHLTWGLFKKALADEIIKKSALKDVCGDCVWFSLCEITNPC
jgi:hypothetical protein